MKLDSGSPIFLCICSLRPTISRIHFEMPSSLFPSQRAIVSSSGETLFTITPESIDQMLQIPRSDPAIPFSIEALNDLYQKLTFPQRAQIFEIFLPEDAQLPKKNPPIHPPSSLSGPTRSFPFFVTC
jgi:hypothetical protein